MSRCHILIGKNAQMGREYVPAKAATNLATVPVTLNDSHLMLWCELMPLDGSERYCFSESGTHRLEKGHDL